MNQPLRVTSSGRWRWLLAGSLLLVAVLAFIFINAQENGTGDACAPGRVATTIKPITDIMREFDDLSVILSNQPRDQIADTIEKLQARRRALENLVVDECALRLKANGLFFMEEVISTGVGFMSGASEEAIADSIERARDQRDLYEVELARLLGITPAVQP